MLRVDVFGRMQGLVAQLLAEQPELVAIYNVGAGNRGIAAALQAAGPGHGRWCSSPTS